MISCKKAAELKSRSLDEELSWYSRVSLKVHLKICKVCRIYSHQVEQISNLVSHYFTATDIHPPSEEFSMPDDAKNRIKQTIKEECEQKKDD